MPTGPFSCSELFPKKNNDSSQPTVCTDVAPQASKQSINQSINNEMIGLMESCQNRKVKRKKEMHQSTRHNQINLNMDGFDTLRVSISWFARKKEKCSDRTTTTSTTPSKRPPHASVRSRTNRWRHTPRGWMMFYCFD